MKFGDGFKSRYHPKQPWRGGQVLEKRGSLVHPSRLGRQTSPEEGPRWTRGRNSATTPTAPHGGWSAKGTSTSIAAPNVATDAPPATAPSPPRAAPPSIASRSHTT